MICLRRGGALSISQFRLPLMLSLLSHGHTHTHTQHARDNASEIDNAGVGVGVIQTDTTEKERLHTAAYGVGGWYGGESLEIRTIVVPASEDSDSRHESSQLLVNPAVLRRAVAAMLHDAILGVLASLLQLLRPLLQAQHAGRERQHTHTRTHALRQLRLRALEVWSPDIYLLTIILIGEGT